MSTAGSTAYDGRLQPRPVTLMMPDPPESPGTRPPSPPDDSPTSPVDLPPVTPPPASTPPALPPSPAAPAAQAPSPAAGSPTTPGPRPAPSPQPGLVIGIILVLVGGVLLLTRVADVALGPDAWPLWIVVPGVAMLLASFAVPPRGGLGLAVPGSIIATVGLVLWVQAANDAYATWAYAWALVGPTAVGVGTMLYGLVKGDRELARDGFRTMLVGLALFGGFALFFEGVLGLSGEPIPNLDEVLPYAVIGLGLLLVAVSFLGGRRTGRRSA